MCGPSHGPSLIASANDKPQPLHRLPLLLDLFARLSRAVCFRQPTRADEGYVCTGITRFGKTPLRASATGTPSVPAIKRPRCIGGAHCSASSHHNDFAVLCWLR